MYFYGSISIADFGNITFTVQAVRSERKLMTKTYILGHYFPGQFTFYCFDCFDSLPPALHTDTSQRCDVHGRSLSAVSPMRARDLFLSLCLYPSASKS